MKGFESEETLTDSIAVIVGTFDVMNASATIEVTERGGGKSETVKAN